ncbi:MAG TPA: SDR family oxidoreductase [Bacillales bacterium]|nr:SDR family oxidoreductase [Bacillales bacterium]
MKVLVIGANGKIGKHIVSKLAASNKHEVRAMVRDESQREELEKRGGEVVIADLEKDFSHAFEGCHAAIFTAGSGAHTGPDKTELVDRQGAMKAVDLAKEHQIARFLIVSSMNADTPDNGPESMKHYYKAKGDADHHLQASGLNYTIVRPGRLSLDPATGKIEASDKIENRGSRDIPREDVAEVMIASLDHENTYNRTFEILSGDVPIGQALTSLQ